MAQYYLSLNRGQSREGQVATATSAPTADVFVQINTANAPTRKDVILLLKIIVRYILSNGVSGGAAGVDLPVL